VDKIKMDLVEIGWGDVEWIGLAQDRGNWKALVSAVVNILVLWNAGNHRVAAQLLAYRVALSSSEIVSLVV
jgi:hypothetical protein